MNLTELKNTPVSELITLGENMGLENQARMRKQDIIFAILKLQDGENDVLLAHTSLVFQPHIFAESDQLRNRRIL